MKAVLRKFIRFIRNVAVGVGSVLFLIWVLLAQPSCRSSNPVEAEVDQDRLREVVKTLSIDFHPRTFRHTGNLDDTVAFVAEHFMKAGGSVEIQSFNVSGTEYANVSCIFGDTSKPRLVVGAHYDSHGMIALEMIGYFSDEPGSQQYPVRLFNLIYPNKGNFIALVGKLDQRDFISDVKAGMKGATELKVLSVAAPIQLPGIDFSDHRNYWANDYKAVMVTDTAFYRNTAYHKASDTWDRLGYSKMADVVRAVYNFALKK